LASQQKEDIITTKESSVCCVLVLESLYVWGIGLGTAHELIRSSLHAAWSGYVLRILCFRRNIILGCITSIEADTYSGFLSRLGGW